MFTNLNDAWPGEYIDSQTRYSAINCTMHDGVNIDVVVRLLYKQDEHTKWQASNWLHVVSLPHSSNGTSAHTIHGTPIYRHFCDGTPQKNREMLSFSLYTHYQKIQNSVLQSKVFTSSLCRLCLCVKLCYQLITSRFPRLFHSHCHV